VSSPLTLEERVELDSVRGLYAQAIGASVVALLAGGFNFIVFYNVTPWPHLLAWYALLVLNQGARIALYRRFVREELTVARARVWANRYALGMFVGGALFGFFPLVFWPENPIIQAVIVIGIYAMGAGSTAANAHYPRAMFAYLAPLMLPTLVWIWTRDDFLYRLLAAGIVLFSVSVLGFGLGQVKTLRDSIRIRHENLALIEELRAQKELAEAAQRKAEQASLAKSQFFAAASHDLRQPMQALGLFAASLRETKREPEDARRIDQILSSVDTLESLFDELLDISKLDAGYVKPVPSHFRVQALFERIQNAYLPLARKSGLALAFEDGGAVLHSDSVLLERVLGNLVSNALRYTPAGSVTVGTRLQGARVVIEVADTGIGIPPEEHARVFDEFYQLGNPERDRRKGLGLGLATVRRIARLLDCPVSLESAPGRGSMFRIEVPAGDPVLVAAAAAAPRAEDLDSLHGKLIGVIDDERDVREGLAEMLGIWRCKVVAAASARELLERLDAGGAAPDAVIADYRLREHQTGASAVDTLRKRYGASLPALIMSGDTTQEIFKVVREQRLPLLSKPVRAARLRAALAHLLVGARA